MDPIQEKQVFVDRIMQAIEEVGYASPDFYVNDDCILCDAGGNAIISLAADSPTAVIKDLAKALEMQGY